MLKLSALAGDMMQRIDDEAQSLSDKVQKCFEF